MSKWIKAHDGHYYNLDSITEIIWKCNTSAVGARFELRSSIGMLASCNSEAERESIIRALESFLESSNDNNLLIIPKY